VLRGGDALRLGTWDAALSFLGDQARTTPLTVILGLPGRSKHDGAQTARFLVSVRALT
jgi:hypothetical protein